MQVVRAVVHHNAAFGRYVQQAADIEIRLRIGFVQQPEIIRAEQCVETVFQTECADNGTDVKRRAVGKNRLAPVQTA